MFQVSDIKESLERARMVSQVLSLTVSGNTLFVQSTMATDPKESDNLHRQGQVCINKANSIRDAFWSKFPKAFIPPSCPWMQRNG